MPKKLVFFDQLESQYNIPWTRMEIRRKEADKTFPRHVNLGPNTIAWIAAEIEQWVEDRIAERDAEVAAPRAADPPPKRKRGRPPKA